MSVAASDIAAAIELFAGVGRITSRKMMGGVTFFADGRVFAVLDAEGQLFLKAKGDFASKLEAEGSRQFSFDFGPGKGAGTMGYWTLPDAALDDPDVACDWARQALTAAEGT